MGIFGTSEDHEFTMGENTKFCQFAFKICPACDRGYDQEMVICPADRTMLLTPQFNVSCGNELEDWLHQSPYVDSRHCVQCLRHFYKHDSDRCPHDNSLLVTCTTFKQEKGPTLEDRYVLDKYIGCGTRSDVVRAFDLEKEEFVAIKFLHYHHFNDKKTYERFLKLTNGIAVMNHPNVMGVLSAQATWYGRLYVVMKFIVGDSLKNKIETLKNDPGNVVETFIALCSGLAHAHGLDIVHSNILPSNIYIASEDGTNPRPMLVDFGIAERMFQDMEWDRPSTDTHTASVYGSAKGFAPEFCGGTRPTPQSDIYQLGCCLYEALVGKPVFEADNMMSVIVKHLYETPKNLGDYSPIPERLRKAVLKCLEKQPQERFQTATELQNELEACIPDL
jgi:Serine/threonine protein kinase